MDTVSRFGGDEFTLLFEDLTSEQEVVLIAERIRQAVSTPMGLDQGETAVTVSIGIAMVTDPTVPPETVIREADAAMYRAKEQGPSRYEVYGAAIRQEAHERLGIEDALRHAVERGELHVHYQPKISLNGHVGVNGFEAFVLWDHPQRGLLTPDEFAPLAEETGTLKPIAEFVLDEALRDIRRWREARPGVTVSVNLFPHQLEDADLAPMLARALEASGTTPDALWLEVSESALSANPQVSTRALTAMKALGVMVAIDDYGTSSSMLLNLRSLPVDSIKIHRSFVRALGSDPAEATVVGAVVELGHALGLRVEAEGVETDQQLAQLRLLGCDGAQGPLFSPAVPSEEAHVLLTAG
jgi:predicted signal transduction protein with EAL and GGDEF domain